MFKMQHYGCKLLTKRGNIFFENNVFNKLCSFVSIEQMKITSWKAVGMKSCLKEFTLSVFCWQILYSFLNELLVLGVLKYWILFLALFTLYSFSKLFYLLSYGDLKIHPDTLLWFKGCFAICNNLTTIIYF